MFTVHKINNTTHMPESAMVSSVALIAINDQGQILATRHKNRGWDIPGGHVEDGESIEDALAREVLEETGATFSSPLLAATITSDTTEEKYRGKSMLIFATRHFDLLDSWVPADDVSDLALMNVKDMLAGYSGDKEGMRKLIALANERLNETV